jgi:cytochrome c biogenesis protein CcdA/thiol-disulfide isomerase/thioredoxin
MVILVLFSILSGIVTVLSPCILPVLPIILSSSTASGKARPFGVIAGLIISFSVFTLAISRIVSLLGLSATVLRLAAVILIGLLGLGMVIPAFNGWIENRLSFLPGLASRGPNRATGTGFWPGFLTGTGLGLIWAPCAGPILAAVTTLAATQTVTFGAVVVVIAYALGAGIPLLAISYGGRALANRIPVLTRNLQRVQQGFGVAMILTAVLIGFGADTMVTTWVTNLVPASWTVSLNSFETSPAVSQALGQLKPTPGQPAMGGSAAGTTDTPATPSTAAMDLPNLGPAPELVGINHWINSEPLTLKALRGKVVLIDFWTYSCINCIRTLPYVTDWYNKYKDQGLVVIGVHSPEFAFEHETPNVEAAAKQIKIVYPIAQDNDFATWQAYNNQYWPAEYFIDAKGNLRHTHFGEGNYAESEKILQALLAEAGKPVQADLTQGTTVEFSQQQTPETYVGLARQGHFASPEPDMPMQSLPYTLPSELPLHAFAVTGHWDFQSEFAQETEAGDQLVLHFYAKDVYLVMSSDQPVTAKVSLAQGDTLNHSEDLNARGQITVGAARLYHLVKLDRSGEGMVTLQFDQPGVRAYAFTFGG